jgi:hypothetical protein
MNEAKKYAVSVSKAVDFNLMTPFTTKKSYWLGFIRCDHKTVARTGKHKTRKAAKSEVEKLLKQIEQEV